MPKVATEIRYCDLCAKASYEVVTADTGHEFCTSCWDWRWGAVNRFLAQIGA